jgi:murein DD-endopeptidase / murein LD-carboxypeptidase
MIDPMRNLTGKTFLFILGILLQLFITSCNKKVYRSSSMPLTEPSREEIRISETKKIPVPRENSKGDNQLKNYPAEKGEALILKDATPDGIINVAKEYLGVKHCMGGTSKKCIDCSGLIMVVFRRYGIQLPHSAQDQSRYGTRIMKKNQLTRGDLVFFKHSYKTSKYITHVGIYLGDNKFIHASVYYGVSVTTLDDKFWKDKFVFGTRVF